MKNYFWFILLLASCQSPSFKGEQCAVSLVSKKCTCRQYEYNISHIGGVGEVKQYDLEHCDRLIGMTNYIGFHGFLEKVRLEIIENTKLSEQN